MKLKKHMLGVDAILDNVEAINLEFALLRAAKSLRQHAMQVSGKAAEGMLEEAATCDEMAEQFAALWRAKEA